ncbi:uncharacterized protein A4U43_C02F13790 [Asparagus officinalis]|uniref:Uncharacterized protein n=1 Tax=Asparagus officinalis TaxID=4686 RepID=A0A5P1FIA2_ASPOF|nr:uncharacterized protein A4U43_C02F13790 [Asparagus officinalis]
MLITDRCVSSFVCRTRGLDVRQIVPVSALSVFISVWSSSDCGAFGLYVLALILYILFVDLLGGFMSQSALFFFFLFWVFGSYASCVACLLRRRLLMFWVDFNCLAFHFLYMFLLCEWVWLAGLCSMLDGNARRGTVAGFGEGGLRRYGIRATSVQDFGVAE